MLDKSKEKRLTDFSVNKKILEELCPVRPHNVQNVIE